MPVVESDPDRSSGTSVFAGARVPVRNLVDDLAAGDDIEEFLPDVPTVRREQVEAFLQRAADALIAAEAR